MPFVISLLAVVLLTGLPAAHARDLPERISQQLEAAHEAFYSEDYPSAVTQYQAVVALLLTLPVEQVRAEFAVVYNNLAESFEMVGRANIAVDYYQKAYESWGDNYTGNYSNKLTALNNLVYILGDYGDLRTARQFTRELVALVEQALSENLLSRDEEIHARLSSLLTRVRVSALAKDADETAQLITETDRLMLTLSTGELASYNVYFVAIHEAAGVLFTDIGRYEDALRQYRRMTEFELSDFFEMKFHANTAVAHNYAGNYETSLYHTELSLRYFEENRFMAAYMSLLTLKATNFVKLGRAEEALDLVAEVFSEMLGRDVALSELKTLTYADLGDRSSSGYLSNLLRNADLIRDAAGDRDTARNLYLIATEMFNEYYRKEAYNNQLEFFHKRAESGLLELVMDRPETEQIDAVTRLENNNSQQFWRSFVLKNERYLGENLPQQAASERVDIHQVRARLHAEEILIRYYLSDEALFAVTMSRDFFRINRLAHSDQVAQVATELHARIIRREPNYQTLTDSLYAVIIAPLNLPPRARLVIIPDGLMSYIPFEILSDGREMLVQRHPIRYSFSMRFAGYAYPEVVHERFLATYAPDYAGTDFAAIRHSMEEALVIANRLGGVTYRQEHASKSAFLANSSRYAIHHLAMHAEQDPFNFENSALIFAGGERLPFYALHTAFIPAEMVVLSACETGVGSLEPGIGLMGLSRALAYAGVRSSVHSLWQVPDRETATLMMYFYEALRNGEARDEALRQAKLRFMSENPLQSHPYYWAGFVLNGTYEPLMPHAPFRWPYLAGLGLGMLLVLLLIRLRRTSKTVA